MGKLRNLIGALGLATALSASACGGPCERPHVEPVGQPKISYQTEDVKPEFYVKVSDSKTTFGCKATYINGPNDPEAPKKMKVQVCVKGGCSTPSTTYSEIDFWSRDWDKIEYIDKINCIASQDTYFHMEGLLGEAWIVDTVPEHVVMSAYTDVAHSCIDVPDIKDMEFCSGGYWDTEESRWVCSEGWYQ